MLAALSGCTVAVLKASVPPEPTPLEILLIFVAYVLGSNPIPQGSRPDRRDIRAGRWHRNSSCR